MTIFLIIGILLPIIYVIRLNVKQQSIHFKEVLITVGLSVIGFVVFSILGVSISHQKINIFTLLVGGIVTGIIWGLLLVGTFKLCNYLTHTFKK
ncbi:hypothetical protein MT340_006175 [Staphylococcus sp. NRL 16/872]|uniref:hypothetical protein n=1 Tax=Staphylococcus sp. NRL 16/872 TaxID=2930131 RepID=UPI001FB4FBEC|nr:MULTISPECIES: hypothetical protein [unclassified Staphylococcus]MCJ1656181.1 hypothetical protein [Staphylococcus sp. NRL 21/187]MCJ1661952.1 hypothetical protein [Staphylococcus sp. NRL 18/288]MCJ1668002.1 hypothetical protein [Staphylococcus sp. NRL 19/737]WEN70493.1 hypothetical protein MT340_006175 [Staphylococcus sp. NRL 16/872]